MISKKYLVTNHKWKQIIIALYNVAVSSYCCYYKTLVVSIETVIKILNDRSWKGKMKDLTKKQTFWEYQMDRYTATWESSFQMYGMEGYML